MMLERAALACPSPARQWLWPGLALAGGTALWIVAYWAAIAAAVQSWWVSPSYSYCFLIIPICGFLVWLRRQRLASMTPLPFAPALLLGIPAGLLWLAGNAAMINEVQQFAAILMIQMLILGIVGPRVYRALLFPCLFLFFLVPTGEYLLPYLQRFTTWFVSTGLTLLGILHYTEGNMILLANGNFEVAQACAGLRFLTSNVVLCVLFAYFAFRRPLKIALFMLAAVIVPIIGNGFRALFIVLLAHFTDNHLAVGADHLVYGWGFSVLLLFLLFAAASRFRDRTEDDVAIPYIADLRPPPRHFPLLAGVAALLTVAPPAIASARDQLSAPYPFAQITSAPAGWTIKPAPGHWTPDLAPGEPQLQLQFQKPGQAPVEFFLDYYRSDAKDHSLVLGLEHLWDEHRYNLVSISDVAGNAHVPRFAEMILDSGHERRMVWWTYWRAGHFTTSGMQVRWLSLKSALSVPSGSAFVAISVPMTGTEDDARRRLRAALWAFSGIPSNTAEQS